MVKYDGTKIIDEWHSVIQPPADKKIDPFLLALVSFSKEELEAALPFEELQEAIARFTEGTILVGLHIRLIYALLRKEFKRCDVSFLKKHICLNQLIQRQSDTKIRSVTVLCKKWGIQFSHQQHLAQKALAMTELFKKLLLDKHPNLDKKLLKRVLDESKYPPNLSRDKIERLPNATGVYYFTDLKGRILYLGKSTDIRTRVLSHFRSDLDSASKQQFKAQIHDVQCTLTGSELLALLLESDEIKRYMPTFNRAQRRKKYRFGAYIEMTEEGYKKLSISSLRFDEMPIMKFTTQWQGIHFSLHAALQFEMNLALCGVKAFEKWFESKGFEEADFLMDVETPEAHNAKMEQLIRQYSYPSPNLLIVEKGRKENEVAVVFIENNQYQGYGYYPTDLLQNLNSLDPIHEDLIPFRDNPDVQRIIRGYLRKYAEQAVWKKTDFGVMMVFLAAATQSSDEAAT